MLFVVFIAISSPRALHSFSPRVQACALALANIDIGFGSSRSAASHLHDLNMHPASSPTEEKSIEWTEEGACGRDQPLGDPGLFLVSYPALSLVGCH